MYPKPLLRAEGVAAFVLGTFAFFWYGGPLWLFLLLALSPDLSMVGFLGGPATGAVAYNAAHTFVVPLVIGVASLWADVHLGILVASVWVAHIGADRALGYGLKYPSGFKNTHLG